MPTRTRPIRTRLLLGLAACGLALTITDSVRAADKVPRAITNPRYIPDAEKVGLFDGMKDGKLEAMIIPKDAQNGFLFVMNKGDEPVTVQLPPGFVGQQVNPQFGGGGGFGGGGFGGGGLGGGGLGGGGGGAQALGGGAGGGLGGGGLGGGGLGGGGLGGGGVGGGGFFSIPAESVVRVNYRSACLEHGKPEPRSKMRYYPVPVDQYTSDPELQTMIEVVSSGRVHPQVAQAATWHLSDKMSFQELAAKTVRPIGKPPQPYFSRQQLIQAQMVVAKVKKLAKQRPQPQEEPIRSSSETDDAAE